MDKPIKIRNEEFDLEGECMPSALKVWERNGWTAVEDGSSENVKAVAPVPAPKIPVESAKVQPDPNSKE